MILLQINVNNVNILLLIVTNVVHYQNAMSVKMGII